MACDCPPLAGQVSLVKVLPLSQIRAAGAPVVLSCGLGRHGRRVRKIGSGRFRSGGHVAPGGPPAAQIAGVEAMLAQDAHGDVGTKPDRAMDEDRAVLGQLTQSVTQLAERNVNRAFKVAGVPLTISAFSSRRRNRAAAEAPPATPPTMMTRFFTSVRARRTCLASPTRESFAWGLAQRKEDDMPAR